VAVQRALVRLLFAQQPRFALLADAAASEAADENAQKTPDMNLN
jgi:hypothetical protein